MVGRLLFCLVILATPFSQAEVLFEGYSKVMSGGVHIGFYVSRYEFDAKKKQFIATSLLKTGELGGNITESLKAYANEDLQPISYSYTSLVGTKSKVIDAKFEKGKILATVKEGANISKINKPLPKGTFLSQFLAYLILKSKDGLKPETKYDYKAVAEEEGEIASGFAVVKNMEDVGGLKAFRIINEFKSSKFISFVNERGEVLSTKSPAQSISTELMAQPSLATGNFPVPSGLLKTLFGDVPTGQVNEVSRKNQAENKVQGTPVPGKQEGVPAGKGIQIKMSAEPTATPTAAPSK